MSEHAQHDDDPHATIDTPGATHDPVCGHWVHPEKAHGTTIYRGETIHFCSVSCHRAFDATPERFFPRFQRAPAPRATASRDAAPPAPAVGFLAKIRGNAAPGTPGSATDPVCHMSVDPKTARGGTSDHGGQTHYFCSPGCKGKFDADPHKFMGPHPHAGGHHKH